MARRTITEYPVTRDEMLKGQLAAIPGLDGVQVGLLYAWNARNMRADAPDAPGRTIGAAEADALVAANRARLARDAARVARRRARAVR